MTLFKSVSGRPSVHLSVGHSINPSVGLSVGQSVSRSLIVQLASRWSGGDLLVSSTVCPVMFSPLVGGLVGWFLCLCVGSFLNFFGQPVSGGVARSLIS